MDYIETIEKLTRARNVVTKVSEVEPGRVFILFRVLQPRLPDCQEACAVMVMDSPWMDIYLVKSAVMIPFVPTEEMPVGYYKEESTPEFDEMCQSMFTRVFFDPQPTTMSVGISGVKVIK